MNISGKLKEMPFVRLVVPFILGIFLSIKTNIDPGVFYFIAAGISLIVLLKHKRFQSIYKYRHLTGIAVFIFFVFGGWFFTSERSDNISKVELPEESVLIAEIESTPKETEKSVKAEILINAFRYKDDWHHSGDRSVIYLQKDSMANSLKPGMKISFKPDFDEIKNAGNPKEFDYSRYMAFHMIASQMYLKSGKWQIINKNTSGSFKQRFLNLRSKLLNIYKKSGLKNDEFAVAAALSLGYKDKLSDEIRHAYSSSGAMHILAVSGLHVGIIFMVLQFILSPLNKSKKLIYLKVLITLIAIWFYAALTGMSPSVTRAAIMFSFISGGKLFRQNINIYNILAASAFVTLIINPFALTELGFWLSYLAVISIVTFYKPIYKLIKPKWIVTDKIWSLISVSIAAQIGTAPLTIFFFNQFSNYFILTNILVIPIVTVIVYLAIFVFAFSFIPIIGEFAGKILVILIKSLNNSVFFIESLPGSLTENLYLNIPQMILLFIIIISLSLYLMNKYKPGIFVALSSFIIFLSLSIYNDVNSMKNRTLVVYNLRSQTALNLITEDEHVLFSDHRKSDTSAIKSRLSGYWLSKGIELEKYIDISKDSKKYMLSNIMTIDNPYIFYKNNYIGFYGIKILMLRGNKYQNKTGKKKMRLDYLLISNDAKLPDNLKDIFDFRKIIIDSSNSWYYKNLLKQQLDEMDIPYHDVTESGAFINSVCP